MNDLMSAGLHRLWKRVAIETIAIRPGMQILDLASGTGDLARAMSRRAGSDGHVVLGDINDQMLRVGRDRCIDRGELKDSVGVNVMRKHYLILQSHLTVSRLALDSGT